MPFGSTKQCDMCNGSGAIAIRQRDGSWKTLKCGECKGTGWK